MSEALCENCAGTDEELSPVWPLPVTGEETPQLWCAGCRDRFPHEPADEWEASEDF